MSDINESESVKGLSKLPDKHQQIDSHDRSSKLIGSCVFGIGVGVVGAISSIAVGNSVTWSIFSYSMGGVLGFILALIFVSIAAKRSQVMNVAISRPTSSKPEQSHTGPAEDIADTTEIWLQFNCDKPKRAMLLGAYLHGMGGSDLVARLGAIGFSVSYTNAYEHGIASLAHDPSGWNMLILDIDGFAGELGLEGIVTDLMNLRCSAPGVVTIIASLTFERDDWSIERLSLADSCIRLPCSAERIVRELPNADANNAVWRERNKRPADNSVSGPQQHVNREIA